MNKGLAIIVTLISVTPIHAGHYPPWDNPEALDAQLQRQWAGEPLNTAELTKRYTSHCQAIIEQVSGTSKEKLCQLVAAELIDTSIKRSIDLEQFVPIETCHAHEIDSKEYCEQYYVGKLQYPLQDAIITALCKTDTTFVQIFDHYMIAKRRNSIYRRTERIYDCEKEWFESSADSTFSIQPNKPVYEAYPDLRAKLHFTLINDHKELFSELLSSLDNSQMSSIGFDLLDLAIVSGSSFYVEKVISSGLQFNAPSDVFEHPIFSAILNRKDDAVAQLLRHGSEVNVFDKSGVSALYRAVEHGSFDTIEAIISAGADVDGQLAGLGYQTGLPLSRAAELGRADVVDLLLANGASVEVENPRSGDYEDFYRKDSFLAQAARGGNAAVFTSLRDHGAVIQGRHEELIKAAIRGTSADILETLFEMGVRIPQDSHRRIIQKIRNLEQVERNEWHRPPAQRAAQLEFLVQQGLRFNNDEGKAYKFITWINQLYYDPKKMEDPLRRLYAQERQELVLRSIKLYAELGFDINYNGEDKTLLHDAARGENLEAIELLITLGADLQSEQAESTKKMVDHYLKRAVSDADDQEKIEYFTKMHSVLNETP